MTKTPPPQTEQKIDAFIRDVTSVTHISKSEVRSRLQEILTASNRQLLQYILDNASGGGNWRRVIQNILDGLE